MLSWVLSSSSARNENHQTSKNIITGRVSKNVLGLFSNGIQETLEVKLRLVPLPSASQGEYLDSIERYREMSKIIPLEFDAQAWTNFLQQNQNLFASRASPRPMEFTNTSNGRAGLEAMQDMLSAGSPSVEMTESQTLASTEMTARPGNRAPTPSSRPQSRHQQIAPAYPSRPASRASMPEGNFQSQSMARPVSRRRESISTGYLSDEPAEDGPTRKRAKVTTASWPGKASFNIEKQPESLRVVASTAASVRIHRPVPLHPVNGKPLDQNEEPIRPPTPVPNNLGDNRRQRPARSNLRQESFSNQESEYNSPYPTMTECTPDPNFQSPEETRQTSVTATPFHMPSSPPVAMESFASSPVLPPMGKYRDHNDSGYMSGPIEEMDETDLPFLGEPQAEFRRPAQRRDSFIAPPPRPSTGRPRTPLTDAPLPRLAPRETGPILSSDAQPMLPAPPPRTNISRPSSRASNRNIAPAPVPPLARMTTFSAVPASDPVGPTTSSLQRAYSWAPDVTEHPATDAPTAADNVQSKTGAGARRIKQIQAKLEESVAKGHVPPYCDNCGAIETPTWRRAWVKYFEGDASNVAEVSQGGEMLFWEVTEKNENEQITKFRVYKKCLSATDKQYETVTLCNPCGLWLHKFKHMRPENKWSKNPRAAPVKRPRRGRSERKIASITRARNIQAARRAGVPTSPADTEGSSPGEGEAETPAPESEAAFPQPDEIMTETVEPSTEKEPRPAEQPPAVAPLQLSQVLVATDTQRQQLFRSSPIRHRDDNDERVLGSTPKPLRRLLFSSPTEGSGKSAPTRAVSPDAIRRSPRLVRTPSKDFKKTPRSAVADDGLSHLFDELDEGSSHMLPEPTTPTPTRRSVRLLKTPGKTPGSGSNNPTPSRQTLTATARALAGSIQTPRSKGLGGPGSASKMTPFSLQLLKLLDGPNEGDENASNNESPASKAISALLRSGNSNHSNHTKFSFDLDDLPDMDLMGDFNDFPMPGSPSANYFNFSENGGAPADSELWSDFLGATNTMEANQ